MRPRGIPAIANVDFAGNVLAPLDNCSYRINPLAPGVGVIVKSRSGEYSESGEYL